MSDGALKGPVKKVLTVGSLCFMGLLDLMTGQEIVFACAYLLPVALAGWWFSRRWVAGMSIGSGCTAFVADQFDGYSYSHPGIAYWNAFTCLLLSLVTGVALARLRTTLNERKKANEELRRALARLQDSTAEIRKLQSGLQVVCAWTKRLKVGEVWMTPDEFLSTQLHLRLSHGISPEAFEEIVKTLPTEMEANVRAEAAQ